MGDSEETVEQNNEILKAIAGLSAEFRQRIDELETKVSERIADLETKVNERVDGLETKVDSFQKFADAQFEAIREGIVHNSITFDRLESEFYKVRSDMSGIRADVKEMSEQVRRKELV